MASLLSSHNRVSFPRTIFLVVFGTALFISGVLLLMIENGQDIKVLLQGSEHKVMLREAEEYLRHNSKESAKEAWRIFNRVLSQDISVEINQQAKYGMAVALQRLEENAVALGYFRELYNQKIQQPQLKEKVIYGLGKMHLDLNHEEEGRSFLDELLRTTKDHILKSKACTAFGIYYMKRGDYKRAEENFKIAIKYNPENLLAGEGQGKAAKGRGLDSKAYNYYNDYLLSVANLNPSRKKKIASQVKMQILNSGIRHYRQGRYSKAIEFFNQASKSGATELMQEKALFWLGESYRVQGLRSKAVSYYDRVLKNTVSMRDQASLFRKGQIDFMGNNFKRAAKHFKRAYKSYPYSSYTERASEYLDEIERELSAQEDIEDSHHKPIFSYHPQKKKAPKVKPKVIPKASPSAPAKKEEEENTESQTPASSPPSNQEKKVIKLLP